MTYGWYKAEERIWYYCHEVSDGSLGKLVKGWHEDRQDGKKYFLDRKTGIMLSGWQEIDGCDYYFATYEEIPQQTWIWKIFGDSGLGRWIYERLGYRSYGSMYIDEKTPDGQIVNEAGIKTEYQTPAHSIEKGKNGVLLCNKSIRKEALFLLICPPIFAL